VEVLPEGGEASSADRFGIGRSGPDRLNQYCPSPDPCTMVRPIMSVLK
jgi:hypothetical protein